MQHLGEPQNHRLRPIFHHQMQSVTRCVQQNEFNTDSNTRERPARHSSHRPATEPGVHHKVLVKRSPASRACADLRTHLSATPNVQGIQQESRARLCKSTTCKSAVAEWLCKFQERRNFRVWQTQDRSLRATQSVSRLLRSNLSNVPLQIPQKRNTSAL